MQTGGTYSLLLISFIYSFLSISEVTFTNTPFVKLDFYKYFFIRNICNHLKDTSRTKTEVQYHQSLLKYFTATEKTKLDRTELLLKAAKDVKIK